MDNRYRKPFKTVNIRTDDIPWKPFVPAFILRHTGIESINVETRKRRRDGYPFYKFRCAMHELPVYRVKFITNEVNTKCCFANTFGTVKCDCKLYLLCLWCYFLDSCGTLSRKGTKK